MINHLSFVHFFKLRIFEQGSAKEILGDVVVYHDNMINIYFNYFSEQKLVNR